jgi:alpha-ketoglutaric semialdehyde dehydrogenase
MNVEQVWIAGEWRNANASSSFVAKNPATASDLSGHYPVSTWFDCDAALDAAVDASRQLRKVSGEQIARFLEGYADAAEANAEQIIAMANAETGFPVTPRLQGVELPRMTTQLRQAAAAAREGSWQQVVIDIKNNIRSHFAPVGPVVVFGPNNFPFAFNGVSGGDFAAAIATGCPVVAKAHPLHPGTTRLLAKCAEIALLASGLPPATVQMLYNVADEDGLRLVSDPRVAASSFTGSRGAGIRLKAAADAAGRLMYLEMSSLNPVVLLPGAVSERGDALVTELADSCLAAAGQFCTSPNLMLAVAGEATERFATELAETLAKRPSGTILSEAGLKGLHKGVHWLIDSGARVATGADFADGDGWRYKNTLLRVSASNFLAASDELQREAFGNSTLLITADDIAQLVEVIESLEGNLTGSIYSSAQDSDATYAAVASALRPKVGRMMNDKMPTGVALSPAMNHGGPFPATSHPGFTSVGIPRALLRFCALHCYDAVREERLPPALRNKAPNSAIWRMIDGNFIQG